MAAVAAPARSASARRAAASLRVVSWNVDGLDNDNDPLARAREICAQLVATKSSVSAGPLPPPDVIMLQEIVVISPYFVNKWP
jgi:exonuclease III